MEKFDDSRPIQTVRGGNNYLLWAEEISSFLKGRKLWRYVTGEINRPVKKTKEEEDAFYDRFEDWDCKNHQILT